MQNTGKVCKISRKLLDGCRSPGYNDRVKSESAAAKSLCGSARGLTATEIPRDRASPEPGSLKRSHSERKVNMLRIMLISDMEKFLEKVQSCHGDVLLHLPDDTVCNLKEDHTALQMLKMMQLGGKSLDLSLTDVRDYGIMMNYMMNAA